MSYTLQKVKNKNSGIEYFDLVNDSCRVHNIFYKEQFVESVPYYFVGIQENDTTPYVEILGAFSEINSSNYVELLEKYKNLLCGEKS